MNKKQVIGHFERTQALKYCNDPQILRKNSADMGESDQELHCLPCHLHLLDTSRWDKIHRLNFRIITSIFSGVTV